METMMKALVCREYGPPDDLAIGELPRPEPKPGQVGVRVRAAAVSYVDTMMVRDLHQNKHPVPFAPGMSFAGEVVSLGEGVDKFSPGDAVMGLVYDGAFAQYACGDATEVFAKAPTLDFVQAAGLIGSHLTSHASLRWEARLREGETMLVLGASGGVGLAAVEIGKAMGARVIAGASSAEKLALAAKHGADEGINYADTDLLEAVQTLTDGKGVDVIYDPVGGDLHQAAFRGLGWGGRYVIIGFVGGSVPSFPANRLLVKNRSAVGFVLMHYRRHRTDLLARTAEELGQMVTDGRLKPEVAQVLSLDEVVPALNALRERRMVGKAVVDLEHL
jgi:NADPH2:quinone reductase